MTFHFDKSVLRARAYGAANRALERLKEDAHNWWLIVVPVGEDRRGHKAGTLRDSWFAYVIEKTTGVTLLIGATAPYAIYVELGTGVMQPRAPLRSTAGEVAPLVPYYFREEYG